MQPEKGPLLPCPCRHIARYIGHSEGCEPEEDIMATLGTSLKARFLVQEYIDCGSLKDLALRQAS